MAEEPRIVIDHVRGSMRGQRHVLSRAERVRFGRHPQSEICFDARRDLDASSHHAELALRDGVLLLRDVGSSNGTFVDGVRVSEVVLEPGTAVMVEFGVGGPRLRIFVGDPALAPELMEITDEVERYPAVFTIGLAIAIAFVVAVAIAAWLVLVAQ